MPQVTPTGCMASNVENFRVLIASTAAMQNWAGVSSQTECLDYVQTYRVRNGNIRTPIVVISEEAFQTGRSHYGTVFSLSVLLHAEVPKSLIEDDPSPNIDFMNNRDAIIKEAIQTGETNDYGFIFDPRNACEHLSQISRRSKTDTEDALEQWIKFNFGIR